MHIQFKGTRYEPTPEILELAEEKIQSLEKLLGEQAGAATALLELERAVGNQRQGDVWRAELNITTLNNRFRAESTKTKLDHAIVTVVKDVRRELNRGKNKNHDLFKKGGSMVKALLRGFKR